MVSNRSDNYGHYHLTEKLSPSLIHGIINKKSLPINGDSLYIRDWLYMIDHAHAIVLFYEWGEGEA